MKHILFLILHLFVSLLKILRPGGSKALIAENIALRQQLMIVMRHGNSLWSIDFFRAEPIHLRSHWVMIVMDQFTRRIVGFSVHKGDMDGINICRMFNRIISQKSFPNIFQVTMIRYFNFIGGRPI